MTAVMLAQKGVRRIWKAFGDKTQKAVRGSAEFLRNAILSEQGIRIASRRPVHDVGKLFEIAHDDGAPCTGKSQHAGTYAHLRGFV